MTSCYETIWKFSFYFPEDDIAPCHASLRTTTWKTENNLDFLDWPSQSPDINIIENVWHILKIRLKRSLETIRNRDDLSRFFFENLGTPNSSTYKRPLPHYSPTITGCDCFERSYYKVLKISCKYSLYLFNKNRLPLFY